MLKFKPTWLMIKQHRITGLKYFCKTVNKDPIRYLGSGKVWKRHLKKHGTEVDTLWCQLFAAYAELVEYAIKFSTEHNIIEARDNNGVKIWANLINENGIDGGGNLGLNMLDEQKLKLADDWEVTTPANEVLLINNMLEFCRKHKLNASAMSAVARGKKSMYKGYKCKKLTNKRNVVYEPVEYVFMTKEERSQQLKKLAVKGGNHHEAVKIEYDGIVYDSIAEAKETTGKSYYLITKYGKRK